MAKTHADLTESTKTVSWKTIRRLEVDGELGNLVGMEALCRKSKSERLNVARLEKVWH